MGIIQKQAIKGTVYSYIGVVIGFITTAILYPRILSPDEVGLLRLLISFSVLFAQFGSLGFNSVINRLFPYFRDPSQNHKGFISFAMLVTLAGFLLTSIAFELYKPVLIRNNQEDSSLLLEYIHLIIPLIFAILFFNLFDTYNKVLYDTILGAALKEFIQRILILLSIILYYFEFLSLNSFILAYAASFFIPTLLLFSVLIYRRQITLKFKKEAFSASVIKEMGIISLFGFLGGVGGLAIVHIDSLLVNRFLGIGMTGIYTITFYFGTLVLIPSRPLIKISTPILAESWKNNDIDNISLVYRKSCLNQSLISILIFIGLWVNIDNIFKILPETYETGRYVIFFIGLANVFEMSAGVSGMIIGTSKYYRLNAILVFLFLVFLVVLNIILIPVLGLIGAALATTLARLIYTIMRFIFIRKKFKMQPYNYKFIILLIIGFISYIAGYALPELQNYLFDILIRSAAVTVVFGALIIIFRISEDVNLIYRNLLKRISG